MRVLSVTFHPKYRIAVAQRSGAGMALLQENKIKKNKVQQQHLTANFKDLC